MANVGDSRLYRIERSGIHQITRDHSYVEAMVSLGQMSRGSREYETKKNIITRAVGIGGHVEPDFFEVSLNPGDYVLLCSDGLTNMVDNSANLPDGASAGNPGHQGKGAHGARKPERRER